MSNSNLQSLSDIFQKKIFRIPDYQRGYAWQDMQLRDFWEDVVNLQEGKSHYTGLLSLRIFTQDENQKLGEDSWLFQNGFKAYHIVDGQQRLTTSIIMLHEIITFVCNLPENKGKSERNILINMEDIKSIRNKYLSEKQPPNEFITTYMFGYENDNPSAEYLKYRIFEQPFGGTIKETYYTKNLKYAKDFFAKELENFYKLNGIDGITELYSKLTLHLMFYIHEIQDDYDVFVAFETMNNRGKRLTNLELLKNRLIYLTTLYSKDTLDEKNAVCLRELINKAWCEIYYQLGRNDKNLLSDDEFLRAHWIMYYAYSRNRGDDYIKFLMRKFSHKSIVENVVSQNEIIDDPVIDLDDDEDSDETFIPETISEEILKPKDIQNYVNTLSETAEFWYYTFYPKEYQNISDEEKVWIDRLNRIGIGYFRPMVTVSLISRLKYTPEERLNLFKEIERFIFIHFRMAMYQSSYKSSDCYRKTRELYNGKMKLSEITEYLKEISRENTNDAIRVFLAKMNRRFISNDGFYSWRDLKYFLYEYEYSLATKNKINKLSWADLTEVVRDKVTIEHILPQTPTEQYWREKFSQFNDEQIKTLSSSLGNMLPLSKSKNSSLQNESFDLKKEEYTNGCHSEIEVSKYETWDADSIYNRGIKLLQFMENRWGFKFESEEQMKELLHIEFVKVKEVEE